MRAIVLEVSAEMRTFVLCHIATKQAYLPSKPVVLEVSAETQTPMLCHNRQGKSEGFLTRSGVAGTPVEVPDMPFVSFLAIGFCTEDITIKSELKYNLKALASPSLMIAGGCTTIHYKN